MPVLPLSASGRLRASAPVVAVAVGAMLVGAGSYAAWTTSSVATSGSLGAATVSLDDVDSAGTTFTAAVPELVPGDFFRRYRTITNGGSVEQVLSAAVTGSGALAGAGGLTVAVDTCSVAWSSGACSGTTTSVLAATGVSTAPTASFGTLPSTGKAFARYTFALPGTAAYATFGGTSGAVTVTLTGTTRAGADRTGG